MPKIKMLKSTVCGGQNVAAGSEVDASPADAHYLCNTGKAERVTEDKPKTKAKAKAKAKRAPENKMIDIDELDTRDSGE